jgi:hypothetical protein
MNRTLIERYLVVILFFLVMIVFSLAERDSKKLQQVYGTTAHTIETQQKDKLAIIPIESPVQE